MPSNIIQINNTEALKWYISDSKMEDLIKYLDEIGSKDDTDDTISSSVEERSLWRIYIVDPRKEDSVLLDGKVIVAKNENEALPKAGVAQVGQVHARYQRQVDVYAEKIGTFIRPRKETQRVKITKEEED